MEVNADNQEQIAHDYLHGKLSAEEAEAFEVYFLDKPELVEQLALDQALMKHLPPAAKTPAWQRFIHWWYSTPLGAGVGTACASVLLGLTIWPSSTQLATVDGPEVYRTNAVVADIASLRSMQAQDEEVVEITLPEHPTPVVLVMYSESGEDSVDVTVTRVEEQRVVARFEEVVVDMGRVVVVLPEALVSNGRHDVILDSKQVSERRRVEFSPSLKH